MNEAEGAGGDEISLLTVGTTLLRNRWRIVRWMFLGAVVALLLVIAKPSLYRASASFFPQGNDAARSGLASLAGQFGVSLPSSSQSLSPDFYFQLLRSPVVLERIVRDTFVVPELGGQRISFLHLFEIKGGSEKFEEEQGVRVLTGIVAPSVAKTTGLVEVSVATKWPSVSLAIVTALVDGVNEYNQRTRQGQAAAERRFVEGRLAIASTELREAENRLELFQRTNRQFASSPELLLERDRLQRDIGLRQQVFTSLTQANEEVRIREVRDTPVIMIFEPPSVPTQPEPRGRLRTILLGLLLGGFIRAMTAFASAIMGRLRNERKAEADEFVGTLGEVKGEVLGRVRWLTDRIGRPFISGPR